MGLKWDQFNNGTCGAGRCGAISAEGIWYSRNFEFHGVEDSVEPEDHELPGLLGLEDLLHPPLFFYFKYIISHLLIIQYMFSSVFSLSNCDI